MSEVELGSLNLGSVNMFDGVYQNRYLDICFYARKLRAAGITPIMPVFDLSHMINFHRLVNDGEITPPYVFEFVFDVPYALPYRPEYLDILVKHLPSRCTWFCVRHHQKGVADLRRVLDLGGNVRVGYEDSPFLSNGRRAPSNVELVEDAVQQVEKAGLSVATPARAREILGLKPLAGAHEGVGLRGSLAATAQPPLESM